MSKFLSAAFCFAVLTTFCNAQTEIPVKRFNHYVGVQANELLRELIDFNDDNDPIENPYLLIYSFNKISTGLGAHFGFGYDYKNITDVNAPVGRETKVNNLFFRVGFEKRFSLGKRFEAAASIDLTTSYLLDKTFSSTVTNLGSQIDSSATTVTNKTKSFGGGPRVWLGFNITDRLIIGTESTMYFSAQTQKQNVHIVNTTTDLFSNETTVTTSNSNQETDIDNFTITLPVAIFLVVKF